MTTGLATLVLLCTLCISAGAQKTARLTGSITDDEDARISDAHVTLYSLDRILRTTVDSEGQFRFDRLPAGAYELEAFAGGFKTVTKQVNVSSQPADQPIFLKIRLPIAATDFNCGNIGSVFYDPANATAGATVNGMVVEINDKSKVPIRDAQVALFRSDVKISEQQTDERGEFDFAPVAPGRYLVVVTHPRYRELRSSVFWVARENRTRITLDPIPANKIRVCQ